MDEERSSWSFKGWLMKGLAYILELAFSAAAIVVDTLRTFYLVVLSILGPLAFAIAVFDGFQSSLTNWLSKYVSIYLWLPISDLFSAIIARLQILSFQQDTTSGTAVTLIFMVIGICGYMCIPSISTWIVQTGGISSFNHAVARTTKLVTGLMGMAAGKDTPAARPRGTASGGLPENSGEHVNNRFTFAVWNSKVLKISKATSGSYASAAPSSPDCALPWP